MEPCVFCEIVARRAIAAIVYEDDDVSAFLDHHPVAAGHVLVVPKRHLASLAELPEALGARLFAVASRVAAALRASGLPCDGINLFLADGEAAFQEVFHVHLHVIPRAAGDGFAIDARAWSLPRPTLGELESTAGVIRSALD